MQSIISLLISILMLIAGAGAGYLIRRLVRSDDVRPHEAILIDTSLGLGALSVGFFALGAMQLFARWTVIALPLVFVPFGVIHIARILKSCEGVSFRSSLRTIAVGGLFLIIAISVLIPALAPPSGADWDSLAYHLSVPKLYLQHGGFYYIPFMSHSNFPMLTEMLYLPGLALGNASAAKLMHFWMGVLLILATYSIGARQFSKGAGVLAALGVAGIPLVMWEATTAYVDLSIALYTIICVMLLFRYFDTNDRRWLIGCAISAGFAASTKMTGLAVAPMIAIWLIIDRYAIIRQIEWKRALALVAIAFAVASPWYIKSIIYTGNPVYPFFYSVFGGRDWSGGLAQNYSTLQSHFGMGHDLRALILLPYNLTMHSERFYDTPGLFVGPIFLLAIPVMLLLVRYRSPRLLGLIGFSAAQVGVWFALSHQSRYLVPAFATVSLLMAGIVYSDARQRLLRGLLGFAFAATALFGILTIHPLVALAGQYVVGIASHDGYLSRTLDTCPATTWINENTPETALVALYGDTRGFYIDRAYVWADPGHNVEFTRNFSSVDDLLAFYRKRSITHVMINHRFFPKRDKAGGVAKTIYEAIDTGRLEQVYPEDESLGSVGVYKVGK